MIHLIGDSIFQGYALGARGDDIAIDHPLWAWRSPSAVINQALGETVSVFTGTTGLPTWAGVEKSVRLLVKRTGSAIRPGDMLVMLDVGPRAEDLAKHEAQWRRLISAALETGAAEVFVCTGFDGGALGRLEFMHDRPCGARTANDAVRAAVTPPARLLELSRQIDEFDRQLAHDFGERAYLGDGVHLNVWGQLKLCALILAAALPDRAANLESLTTTARISGHPQAADLVRLSTAR